MKMKELIKALSKIEEGIAEVRNIITVEDQKKPSVAEDKEEKVAEKEASEEGSVYSKEELEAMKYNDLKKLGREVGVDVKGTRDELVKRILDATTDLPIPEPVEEENEEKENGNVVPMKKKAPSKKKAVKKEEPEEEPEDDEIEEEYLEQAREALEENELDDVIEVLTEAGIKLTAAQKKKKDVIMTNLAKAFRDGLIDVDDEDDDEDDEEDAEAEDDTEESEGDFDFKPDSYFEQYDPEGINDPAVMSKKRAKAVKALVADIIKKYEEEEISSDDIAAEIGDLVTDADLEVLGEDYSEEELLAFYIELKKKFVDNDGNIVEPSDPYELGESNFCCGHELKYDRKGHKYVCEVCGEEYEE